MLVPSLALVVLAAAISPDEGALLTSLVAAAAGRDGRADVLASEDVRKAVEVEASQQMMGCSASSCLAELAGALGARAVIYGSVGDLGDAKVLTLNIYDSAQGRSGGRAVVRGRTVDELAAGLDAAVLELMTSWQRDNKQAGGERPRLLVMDLDVRAGSATPAAAEPAPSGPSGLLVAGAGTAAIGLGGVILGIVLDRVAANVHDDVTTNTALGAKEANARFDERDTLSLAGAVSLGVGAAVAVVGAGLIGASFVE